MEGHFAKLLQSRNVLNKNLRNHNACIIWPPGLWAPDMHCCTI